MSPPVAPSQLRPLPAPPATAPAGSSGFITFGLSGGGKWAPGPTVLTVTLHGPHVLQSLLGHRVRISLPQPEGLCSHQVTSLLLPGPLPLPFPAHLVGSRSEQEHGLGSKDMQAGDGWAERRQEAASRLCRASCCVGTSFWGLRLQQGRGVTAFVLGGCLVEGGLGLGHWGLKAQRGAHATAQRASGVSRGPGLGGKRLMLPLRPRETVSSMQGANQSVSRLAVWARRASRDV